MIYSEAVKPISYLKAHISEVVKEVTEKQKTLIITHNGEAKVVLQDIKVYENTQESIAFLKLLALSGNDVKNKEYRPIKKSFIDMDNRINDFKRGQSELQS